MNRRMFIELTEAQRELLAPMFDMAIACNRADLPCGIGAQVFPDGLSIKFFAGEQAMALATALGGNMAETSTTALNAYHQGLTKDASENAEAA